VFFDHDHIIAAWKEKETTCNKPVISLFQPFNTEGLQRTSTTPASAKRIAMCEMRIYRRSSNGYCFLFMTNIYLFLPVTRRSD
jgi:hypothetical protein